MRAFFTRNMLRRALWRPAGRDGQRRLAALEIDFLIRRGQELVSDDMCVIDTVAVGGPLARPAGQAYQLRSRFGCAEAGL